MHKITKMSLVFFCILFLSGCASTLSQHHAVYFTTETNTSTGILVKCTTQMGQSGVVGHILKIDDEDPINTEAKSEVPIYLTEGTHRLEVVSVGSSARSIPFPSGKDKVYTVGKPAVKEIYVHKNEMKTIKYKSPFLINMTGSLIIEE